MEQDDGWSSGRVGPFRLGASHEALGPGLGRIYEAWHTLTGAPVLLLRPGDDVEWQPEGPWRVQLHFTPEWSAVALVVEQAPLLADASELANLLVLSTASVTRVEDRPQVRTHLATRSVESVRPPVPEGTRRRSSGRGLALAGLVVLSLGNVWLSVARGAVGPCPASSPQMCEAHSPRPALISGTVEFPGAGAIAFPMPARPFDDQAVPPCFTKLDEVEINGGCWFELARRPPCLDAFQAEYKGKCYLPSNMKRGRRPAQAAQP